MNRAWRHTFPLTALFPSAIPVGSQRVRAICPDPKHAETHPSCVVNYHDEHGWTFHCFACGAHGDALDVLTGREGMTVRAAMDFLCARRSEDDWQPSRRAVPAESAGSGAFLLVCDACRNETAEFSKRDYRLMRSNLAATNAAGRLGAARSAPGESRNRNAVQTDVMSGANGRLDGGRDRDFWTASADLELATLPGWELSAGLQWAIGPKCLERIGA